MGGRQHSECPLCNKPFSRSEKQEFIERIGEMCTMLDGHRKGSTKTKVEALEEQKARYESLLKVYGDVQRLWKEQTQFKSKL